jgi:hypothetical protein
MTLPLPSVYYNLLRAKIKTSKETAIHSQKSVETDILEPEKVKRKSYRKFISHVKSERR